MSVGNNTINLRIPGSTNATANTEEVNDIIRDSSLNFADVRSSSKNLNGTLGSGSGSIYLSVCNGN